MAVAAQGKLNLNDTPEFGSRSVDCFEKLEQIGEGTYGQVFMAKEKETGEVVALKKIRMDNEREGFPITAIREIKILKKLHHENVIKLKEIVTSPGRDKDEHGKSDGNKYTGSIYMVFEYMDHDLTGLSDRPGLQFTVPQIKCYMKQLLTGLHYCHLNQVLHRDIKGSNLLIDNKGNLKLADFGLARSFSSDHSGNLTNRVITLWYRPPELLLGATQYGPAVDMWSVGCIFAELLNGKPILPGKNEAEQISRIYELCGTPDEVNWPGAFKTPWYINLKPSRPMRRRVREVFKHFDRHALELLEKMLALDPSQRISAQDALNAEYFWTEPFPCDPKSLPQYESSHEFQTKKKRQQLRQQEENAKRQKFQHPQSHVRLPPVQQSGQAHPQMRQGPSQANQNLQPPVPTGPGHHYGKPQGPPGGANRYPQGGIPSGGYIPNRGGQGGGYSSSSYSQQGRPPHYVGIGMPGNSCPKGGSGMPANSGPRVGGTGMPGNSGSRGGASGMPAISGLRVGGTGMPGNSGPRGGAIGMSTNSGPRAGGTGMPAISGPRVGGPGMPGNSGPRGGASGMSTNSGPRAGGTVMQANSGQRVGGNGTGMPANSGQRVGGNGMPGNSGPRGGRCGMPGSSGPSGGGGGMSGNGGSRGYGAGPQSNFSQGGPYGAPAAGRGPNMMAGNRNQQQQPQQQQQQYGVWP